MMIELEILYPLFYISDYFKPSDLHGSMLKQKSNVGLLNLQ